MNICSITGDTILKIKSDFISFFDEYCDKYEEDVDEAHMWFENEMRMRIKGLYDQFDTYDENSKKQIADAIIQSAKEYNLEKETNSSFERNSFEELFGNPQKLIELISNAGVMESESDNQPVEDSEILHDREIDVDSNIDFLTLSYGISSDVRRYAAETINAHLADCLFLGSSVIDGVSSAGVTNNDVLNSNIRAYKEYLFGKIKTYLLDIVNNNKDLYSDEVLNILTKNLKLFDLNNVFTGNYEILRPLIDRYINGINSDSLSNTFYTMRNSDDSTERYNAKKKIEAYNAFVFLENFDSYLSSLFGDELRIFNRNTPDVRYQLSEHTSKILTTWREGEDIDVGKEIAKITKFIIETVPRLKWNNDCPKDDFVKFGHFQYIISKIRELVWRPEARKIVFDREFWLKGGNKKFRDEIRRTNPELYEAINRKSLVSLISETKLDPRKKFEILFDLFSDTKFMDPERDVFFTKYFTLMDKDLIYSFAKGLFSSGSRIKKASDSSSNNDFYGAITQTAESIYSVNYIQLHRNEEGQIVFRPLSDMGEYNIRTRIEETINNANSKNIINWDTFSKRYLFEEIRAKNAEKTFQGIKFIIPNNNIKVSVYTDGKVIYSDLNGNTINISFTDRNEKNILPFLDSVLKQNFQHNPIYKDFCKEIMNGSLGMYERLTGFASRILLNQYISSKIIEYGDDKDSPEKQLSKLSWGTNSLGKKEKHPAFNHVRQELALVSSKDIYTLKDLAKAKAFSLGMTTSTTIKNAEGNSLSRQTFDRLLSNFNTQWELIEKNKNSTTKHFQLFRNNGLIRGTYLFNEFFDGKSSSIKSYPRMSVNELAHSQILYNFVGSLIGDADNSNAECRNGNMYIYPCVMSDRGQFPVIKINTNAEIELTRTDGTKVTKKLIEFDSGEMLELISLELGNYYLNIFNNIYEDCSKFDGLAKTYAKKAGIREDLINSIPRFSDDFIYNFRNVNEWFQKNGINVIDFIRNVTSSYNNECKPKDILKLTNQLHFKFKKKGPEGPEISTNRALIALIARYLPETEIGLKAAGVLMSEGIKYYNRSEFWHRMKLGMIDSMLASKFRINTTDKSGSTETQQQELVYLRSHYANWINRSGDMYIAKITVDAIDEKGNAVFDKDGNRIREKIGIATRVNMQRFLDKYGFESLADVDPDDIELNPIVEKYNYIDYLISEEFVNSTVGTFTAFSEKSGRPDDILALESAHITTANKRYMTYASSMHSFRLNALNGMPQKYRIAIIEEMYDKLPTITGNEFDVDASNAATWVNPFYVYLENNSLPNSTSGVTKKPYIHFRDVRTGTGGMIKTASFGLSNNTIRNSFEYRNLMKKMSDFRWRNEDGDIINDLNLLKDYNGNDIHYNGLYFKENGRYFKIIDIEKDQNLNNVYHRTIVEVDESGQEIGSPEDIGDNKRLIVVDTNYKLWQLFGGHNSMEYDESRKKLVWSEKSITNVVEAMNRVGIKLTDGEIYSQDDVFLPLKHSDIAYVTTEEAVKYGQGNLNSAEKMRADNNDPFDTFIIMMLSGGIQLDKEHHADESELSLPTQVVNACGLLGYTVTQANNLYKALQDITNLETSDHMNALKEVLHLDEISSSEAREAIMGNFRDVINKSIVRGIQNGNKESTARTIVSGILSELEGDENYANIMLPLSDNTVQNILVSTVSSALTSLGIKMKMPGLLSVLSPSYGTIKLYADRKLESFNNFDEEIKELQKQEKPIYTRFKLLNTLTNNYNKIELGRTYIIRRVEDITNLEYNQDGTIAKILNPTEAILEHRLIQTPKDYEDLKAEIKNGDIVDITEDLAAGRDLAPYNVRFTAENNGVVDYFQLWDLDSFKQLFKANKIAEKKNLELADIEQLQNMVFAITGNRVTLNNTETAIKLLRRRLQQDLANISKNGSDWKEQLNSVAKEIRDQIDNNNLNPDLFKKYTRFFNIIFGTGDGDVIVRNNEKILLNESNFEDVDKWVQTKLDDNARVYIDGRLWDVDKDSVEIKNYECIMNKTFATSFGLDQFADLHEIKNDRYWFVKQQIKNYQTKVLNENSYTIEFKRSNGNHIYICHGNMLEHSGLRKLNNVMYKNENGKKYRVNSLGKKMYRMLDDTEIYVTADGKNEVIVTNNIGFYANELNYDFIKLSNAIDKTTADAVINGLKNKDGEIAIAGLKQSSNEDTVEYANYLSPEGEETSGDWLNNVVERNKAYHSVINDVDITNNRKLGDIEKETDNYSLKQMFIKGREKHTSFIKSLDIVAARIPAQCMQSFMPMEVVAFDNPDLNNVYVSTYQILLQGSDFDIDTVSLVTYDVDHSGIIRMWSPFASLRNVKTLRASEKIAFPTGKKLELEVSNKNEDRDNLISFLKKHLPTLNIKYDTSDPQKPKFVLKPKRDPSSLENFSILLEDIKKIKIPKNDKLGNWRSEMMKDKELTDLISKDIPFDRMHFRLLLDGIIDMVDTHNLYLNNASYDRKSRIVNNYSVTQIFDIIKDPINLIQAQTSVDACTGPLKETANKFSTQNKILRCNGNVFSKYENMFNTLMGKQGVGIFANGSKAFEAISQYCNMVLNYGDRDGQMRLFTEFEKDNPLNPGIWLSHDDSFYPLFANIKTKDLRTIKSDHILKALAKMTQDTDAAIQLSAMMSLAVDNAKELDLFKLNAGEKTMGMFTYGLSLGMDFNTIARLMTSRTGEILLETAADNMFTDDRGFLGIKETVEYFMNGLQRKNLKKFEFKTEKGKTVVDMFVTKISKFLNDNDIKSTKKDSLPKIIEKFQSNIPIIDDQINLLEELKGTGNSKISQVYNQLIDHIEEYLVLKDTMLRESATKNIYLEDFLTLANGAQEMRTLGNILRANKGVETSLIDLIRLIDNIERSVYDITKEQSDLIDFQRFCFDDGYRLNAIKKYNSVKSAVNILDVISNVPHFFGYLLVIALADQELKQSFKYRSIRKLYPALKKYNNVISDKDSKKLIRGIQDYLSDYLLSNWMQEILPEVIIPKGSVIFDKNGHKNIAEVDTPVSLGTDWGNASFKAFVEQNVVPNLKDGILNDNEKKNLTSTLSDNMFIKNLDYISSTRTVGKNETAYYTTQINMLPRDDTERSMLEIMRMHFNKLNGIEYKYDSGAKMRIVDMLELYTMISNGWKLTESSLVPIFEDYQNRGLLKALHDYIAEIDASNLTIDIGSEPPEDIFPFIAQVANIRSSYQRYIYVLDRADNIMKLRKRVKDDNENVLLQDFGEDEQQQYMEEAMAAQEQEGGGSNDYANKYLTMDPIDNINYFPKAYVFDSRTHVHKFSQEETDEHGQTIQKQHIIELVYEHERTSDNYKLENGTLITDKGHKIKELKIDGKTYNIPELKYLPLVKVYEEKVTREGENERAEKTRDIAVGIDVEAIEFLAKLKLSDCV